MSKTKSDGPFPSGKGILGSTLPNRTFEVAKTGTARLGSDDGVVKPMTVELRAGTRFSVWQYGQTTWGVIGSDVPLVCISFADLEAWVQGGIVTEVDTKKSAQAKQPAAPALAVVAAEHSGVPAAAVV